jgi:hypothetical protein
VDEVLGLVTLNGVALTGVLTLGIATRPAGLAIAGIVLVAVVGSAGLVAVAKVLGRVAEAQAKASRDVAVRANLPRPVPSPMPSPSLLTDQCRTYSQLELDQLDAMSRRAARWPLPMLSDHGLRQPRRVIGEPMNLPVDHAQRLRLTEAGHD